MSFRPTRSVRSAAAVATAFVIAFVIAHVAACGGSGGGDATSSGQSTTTFIGDVDQPDGLGDAALAGASAVQVCVAGTSFCTVVDESGAFTLIADVGGDVVLEFEGPRFSASLFLDNVPRGATVRIENVLCNTSSGLCRADRVDIIDPLNAPPDCSRAVAHPSVLWPPNHDLVSIEIVGVVDADGDFVAIEATQVTQNEPVDAPGSGNTAPDAQLDPLAVRAERSGQGNGRVYTIDFVAADGRGGACAGTVYVCVPHDQGGGGTC